MNTFHLKQVLDNTNPADVSEEYIENTLIPAALYQMVLKLRENKNDALKIERVHDDDLGKDILHYQLRFLTDSGLQKYILRMQSLTLVVNACAVVFREYEGLHLAKIQPDSTPEFAEACRKKARRNAEVAEMCERAINMEKEIAASEGEHTHGA